MDAVFKKMNFKDHAQVLVIHAPESFYEIMKRMEESTSFSTDLQAVNSIEFAIVFVTTQEEINNTLPAIANKLVGDAVLWYCYPKGSSKNYQCNFNRDTGWAIMGQYDLEPVRQVAIDADWSALRFRKVAFIKKITRRESFALTKEAKVRTSKKGE